MNLCKQLPKMYINIFFIRKFYMGGKLTMNGFCQLMYLLYELPHLINAVKLQRCSKNHIDK